MQIKLIIALILLLFPNVCFADRLDEGLKRCDDKRAEIEQILESEGVSKDYFFLALAESTCKTDAQSNKGAAGLWQLTKHTAIHYGLVVNGSKDERLDWRKSTRAAARYLKHLTESFDFKWSIAAYNSGGSNLKRKVGVNRSNFAAVKRVATESYNLALTVEKWRNEEFKRSNRAPGTK